MIGLERPVPTRTVGEYVVQGLLGRTPWATTYAGFKEPEGHVAIKLLSLPETAAPTVLDELEADLLHATRSLVPAVALCARDGGEDAASGMPFVVTPLCSHPSLFDLATTSPLDVGEVTELLTRIGQTLSAGVPHLGLRPHNVFVGPPPRQEVLLSDFGFDVLRRAHFEASARRSGAPPLDRTWLAPEQGASAVSHPARTDVYGAGLLAVFALSGVPLPCDERGLHRVPLDEHAAACGVSIPPEIARVLSRALAVDPLARFETVAELAGAFAAVTQPRSEESMIEAAKRHARATGRVRRFRSSGAAGDTEPSPAPPAVEGEPERPRTTEKAAPPQQTMKLPAFKLRSSRPSSLPTAPPPPGFYGLGVLARSGEDDPLKRTQRMPRFEVRAPAAGDAPTDGAPPPSVHDMATVKRPRFRLAELGARKLVAVAGVSVFIAITSTIVAIVALLAR